MEEDPEGFPLWAVGGLAFVIVSACVFAYRHFQSRQVHRGKVTSITAFKSTSSTYAKKAGGPKSGSKHGHPKVRNQRPVESPQGILGQASHKPQASKVEKAPTVNMRSSSNLQRVGSSNSSPVHSPYAPQTKPIIRNTQSSLKGVKANHIGSPTANGASESDNQNWFPVAQMRTVMSGRAPGGYPTSHIPTFAETADYKAPQVEAEDDVSSSKPERAPIVKRPTVMSISVINTFEELAFENTSANVETVGILGGIETDGGRIVVTHLILPPQHGTHDSCEVDNYEIVANSFFEGNLLQVGWIHTHPGYRTFLSSVDLHNHVRPQSELPEYFAIVYSPKYEPHYEIFSVTDPGLEHLSACPKGLSFHEHNTDLQLYSSADHVLVVGAEEIPLIVVDRRNEEEEEEEEE